MQLTETQTQIRDTARRFAEREITPHAADWDRAAETPRALYTKMAKAGLIGITVAPEHGGAGADAGAGAARASDWMMGQLRRYLRPVEFARMWAQVRQPRGRHVLCICVRRARRSGPRGPSSRAAAP